MAMGATLAKNFFMALVTGLAGVTGNWQFSIELASVRVLSIILFIQVFTQTKIWIKFPDVIASGVLTYQYDNDHAYVCLAATSAPVKFESPIRHETNVYLTINSPKSFSNPSPMQLAPGPLYILRNLPYFAVPSTIVYACLTLAKEHLTSAATIPTWLTVFIAVFSRPAIFFFNRHYSRFADSRNAAANNAVIAPPVRGTGLSLILKLSRYGKGYPGLILD